MSQFPGSIGSIEHPAPQKMSGMAVTALVSSLIFCCPLTTVLGVLLGLIALASISANPAKKGRGVAIAAILIGLVATAGQAWAAVKYWPIIQQSMKLVMEGPGPALTAGFAGDTVGFRGAFHGAGATASDEEVAAFIGELRNRYGAFKSSTISGEPQQPSIGATTIPYPYELAFENATVNAEADAVFADPATGAFVCKLGKITVHDAQHGDLTYPPPGP